MVKKIIKRIGYVIVSGIILVGGTTGCSSQAQLTAVEEITGQEEYTDREKEERIIPLSTALVEILGEMRIEMVGVPKSQYELHESAQSLPSVGMSMAPDVEKILQLEPTHVLALTTLKSMVEPKLKAVGIEAIYLNTDNIDRLKQSIVEIGEIFDKQESAQSLTQEFDEKINKVVVKAKKEEALDVLILFGFPGNYMVATNQSFVGQMVEILGCNNIATHDQMVYMQMNIEELLVRQPDVILRLAHGDRDAVVKMFKAEFEKNKVWGEFEAVKNQRVYDLDDAMFNVSATLDTPQALEELMEILYQ